MEGISDIVDPEKFERQTSYRGKFGWGVPPNIARASVAREGNAIEKPAPLTPAARLDEDEKGVATTDTPGGPQETTVISYSELIGVIRTRVGQLGVRYLDFDKLAGFAEGLSGKAFGAGEVKRLGIEKLFDALRAAGLRLRIEEDPEQTQKMQARIAENFNPRQAKQARPGNRSNLSNALIDEVLKHLANKRGGMARLNSALKAARSNWARHAAKARHAKAKQHSENILQISTIRTLPPPCERAALDACAEQEASAA